MASQEVLDHRWDLGPTEFLAGVLVNRGMEVLGLNDVCMDQKYAPAPIVVHGASIVGKQRQTVDEHYESATFQDWYVTDALLQRCYGKVDLRTCGALCQAIRHNTLHVLPVMCRQSKCGHFRRIKDRLVCR